MKKIIILFSILCCFGISGIKAADVLVSFNGYTPSSPPDNGIFLATGGNNANNGIATLTRDAAGKEYAVNADGVAASQGWDNANTEEKYWIATFSTEGASNLKLTSKQKGSNTGPKDFKIQYKVGNGNWTDLENGNIVVANDNYISGIKENIDLPTAMNNQESVSLRWLCTSTANIRGDGTVANGGVNRLDISVIADGSGPSLSNDATLSSLKVDGAEIIKAGTVDYTYTLADDATVVPTITYVANDVNATIGSVTLPTLEGIKNGSNNQAIIPVTAENGTTEKTYTITFSIRVLPQNVVFMETCGEEAPTSNPRPAPADYTDWDNYGLVTFSGNADLRATSTLDSHVWFAASTEANPERSLIISGINTTGKTDLKLTFDITTNVSGTDANVMTVKVKDLVTNNETTLTVPSKTLEQHIYETIANLEGIPATSNLELTFLTGVDNTAGYRIDNIIISAGDTTPLSGDNNLSSLSVSAGTLNPVFAPETTTYRVELEEGASVPAVSYNLSDSKASAVKTDASQIPGTTTIVVTAENGNTKTYSINFSYKTPVGVWIETFETGVVKASYAIGENPYEGVMVNWEAAAVISDQDANDKKNGSFSARLRDPNASNAEPHYLMMVEDKANGAGSISFYTGMYGTHSNAASIIVEVSNNGGSSWDAFSQTVDVTAEWEKVTLDNVNVQGDIRIKLTKQSEQVTSSVNIDDIMITDYGTNICNVEDAKSFVYANNNTLYILNSEMNAVVRVYDLNGRLIKETTQTEVSLPAKGIYIVKVDNQAHKVINK